MTCINYSFNYSPVKRTFNYSPVKRNEVFPDCLLLCLKVSVVNPNLTENCLSQLVATYLLPLPVTSGSVSGNIMLNEGEKPEELN